MTKTIPRRPHTGEEQEAKWIVLLNRGTNGAGKCYTGRYMHVAVLGRAGGACRRPRMLGSLCQTPCIRVWGRWSSKCQMRGERLIEAAAVWISGTYSASEQCYGASLVIQVKAPRRHYGAYSGRLSAFGPHNYMPQQTNAHLPSFRRSRVETAMHRSPRADSLARLLRRLGLWHSKPAWGLILPLMLPVFQRQARLPKGLHSILLKSMLKC